MQMSDWNLLQTLYTYRSLTRAAQVLYLSQPTLSKRLRAIEEEFGTIIAIRGKQGLTFTPEGEYLAVKAAQINTIFQEARQHLAQLQSEADDVLSIGASSSIARFFLPAYLQRFRAVHPRIRFELATHLSSQIAAMVEQGKLQLGLVNGDLAFSGEKKRVLVEHAYLACSFPISLEQLPSLPYLTYFKDPASQRLIENWWREHYPSPFPQGLTVKDGTICREMIFQGLGYSIFFTKGYMEDRPEYQMPLYHRDGTPFTRSTWLIWQQSRCRSNILQELIHLIPEQ